ncbi:MAG: glycoside hydrolase family 88 protein [Bacteroidales bacterium]|nr:glycoside hydrolase family 88 protein [Bacteroidales bacterium]
MADPIKADNQLNYCHSQIKKTLHNLNDSEKRPRSINSDKEDWSLINIYDWTSGFWPGILWYDYENTQDPGIKEKAIHYTESLSPLLDLKYMGDHDLGFQLFCSFGNAYRLTHNEKYKEILLKGAEKLAGFYNKKVGTILSWPHMVQKMNWPHNTIMDNMMNLEILFWASKNGGDKKFYDIALSHAKVTKDNQFRPDGSCYHVAVYDTITGKFIKGLTNQGYNDESMWARGQAWAIYGYTMVYRETKDKKFLRFLEKITDLYLRKLPDDYVPYWDFCDPSIPNAPRDASSAAIVASGLLELSQLEDNVSKRKTYFKAAVHMLNTLSSDKYIGGSKKPAFILHATGNYPSGYEIDAAINYADYYYIEALNRYKKFSK